MKQRVAINLVVWRLRVQIQALPVAAMSLFLPAISAAVCLPIKPFLFRARAVYALTFRYASDVARKINIITTDKAALTRTLLSMKHSRDRRLQCLGYSHG